MIELRYIKFQPRPKKDGLHESGYRFIRLVGVDKDNQEHDLGEWHDHLIVEPQCNIDVEPDGTIRIWPGRGLFRVDSRDRFWTSTASIREDGTLT